MNSLFLKLDGIKGESQDAHHQGWIDVSSYSWGTHRTGNGPGASNYQNLTVHCKIDKATAAILLYASNGRKLKEIELSACKSGGVLLEYYRITLVNSLVVEVMLQDSGTDNEIEYEFQADSIKFQYWEQGHTGGKAAETRMGWDIKNSVSTF